MLLEVVQGSFDDLSDDLFIALSFLKLGSCHVDAKLGWIGLPGPLQHTLGTLVRLKFCESKPEIDAVRHALHSFCE